MTLAGKNIVVYDCEIAEEIDGKNVTWTSYQKMGLSVAALYDYRTDDFSVYFQDNIQELCARLNTADLVVGFNITGFDNNLIRGLGGDLKPDSTLKNYDLLMHSRFSIGWKPDMQFPRGMKLDDHLLATFGTEFMKTEDGAQAPVLWKKGERARVISYCLADVKRERMLFEQVVNKGWAATKTHGKRFFNLEQIDEIMGKSFV